MTSIRRSLRGLSLLAAVAAVLGTVALPAAATDEGRSRLLVTFAAPVDAEDAAAGLPVVDGPHAPTPGSPDGSEELAATSAVQVLDFDSGADAAAAERLLARRSDVVAVEPDTLLHVARGSSDLGPEAWGLRNDGQTVASQRGRARVDVGATEAWGLASGRGVVVAVVDTGVDLHHPLLRDQLWRNPNAATPRTDPVTGRTYVDDLHGWNFVTTETNRNGSNRLYTSASLDAHGTHVAGIIAGARESAAGFSGVAPDARLMVLKFLEGETGRVSDAIAAIRYAQANGAHVINASWTSPYDSPALRTALRESGLPVVVAAGNSGQSLDQHPLYPAAWRLPNVISVAAIDNAGALPAFTARSRERVDVVGPGAHIVSTLPGGGLGRMSGTSQAAPHVTGAVALALQHHRHASPTRVADAVRAGVRPLPGLRETRSGGLVRAPLVLDHLGTSVPACPRPAAVAFPDVRPGSAHHASVACLVTHGITAGRSDGRYGATDGLTRGQVAAMVARALDRAGRMPAVPARGRYLDVPQSGYVHRDAIEALAAVGIVSGRTATTFAPGAITTRAEFAAIVTRANEHLAGAPYRIYGPRFPDAVGHAEEGPLRAALGLRVVAGRSDGTFGPDVAVRRDQAASMLGRLLDRLVQQGLLEPAR
ncbi:S8 family serine peptidase [Egicoccus halophilus]|uniref:SLH domain-containing protein n=1 Tax=Egicoccus halophilus TaxID=1670830 RepID=A0A8J3EXL3_9ACTN|nr:S8 family serine peptidase [Egicoccus halophilus]GGI05951.1 hypothetical protein GCM10011354_16670 [Egicoccus halophilus]